MSGFSVSGLGSGIDFSLYVDAIIQGETEALARTLGKREVKTASQQAIFSNVKGALNSLNSAIRAFKFSGDFKQKVVTVSDPTVASASASLSALNQSAQIEVTSLARSEVQKFEMADTTSSVTSSTGEVTINVRGTDHTFEVEAGTTLAEFAQLINSRNIGITASAFNNQDPGDPVPAKLTITDNQAGDWSGGTPNVTFDFSNLTEMSALSPSTIVTGTNAEATVNGETVFSDSNVLTGILPGVNITLLGTTQPGEPISINVNDSLDGASEQIENLVNKFNEVIQILRQATSYNTNDPSQSGPTAGDTTLRNVLTRLQADFTASVTTLPDETSEGTYSIRSLADLGITSNFDIDDASQNGSLRFDKTQFNQIVSDDFDDVIAFFEGITLEGSPYNGWVDKLEETMDSFLSGTDGAISAKIKSLNDELNRLAKEKQEEIEKIRTKEERLTLRFARLEGQLAGLNAQQSALDASIQSIQLNNQAIARRSK